MLLLRRRCGGSSSRSKILLRKNVLNNLYAESVFFSSKRREKSSLNSWEEDCPLVASICAYREYAAAAQVNERAAIFMAGMPGSGKTRVIDALYGLEEPPTKILDLDIEIKKHSKYDPNRPEKVYDVDGAYNWANQQVEEAFQAALRDPNFKYVILDGTGTKVGRRLRRIQNAKDQGLATVLIYVQISFEKALERNAKRKRVVPPHRLKEYQLLIEEAIQAEKSHVDCFQVIDNDPEFNCRLAHIAQLQHNITQLNPCVASTTHVLSYQQAMRDSHSFFQQENNPNCLSTQTTTMQRQTANGKRSCARCGSLIVQGGLFFPTHAQLFDHERRRK
mmetsp:Transcript_660/g.844  ORF Transcript_660/g.844 Transcript_660/m.844 type:complete len:334 (-) Transcript_660:364-1365(-)